MLNKFFLAALLLGQTMLAIPLPDTDLAKSHEASVPDTEVNGNLIARAPPDDAMYAHPDDADYHPKVDKRDEIEHKHTNALEQRNAPEINIDDLPENLAQRDIEMNQAENQPGELSENHVEKRNEIEDDHTNALEQRNAPEINIDDLPDNLVQRDVEVNQAENQPSDLSDNHLAKRDKIEDDHTNALEQRNAPEINIDDLPDNLVQRDVEVNQAENQPSDLSDNHLAKRDKIEDDHTNELEQRNAPEINIDDLSDNLVQRDVEVNQAENQPSDSSDNHMAKRDKIEDDHTNELEQRNAPEINIDDLPDNLVQRDVEVNQAGNQPSDSSYNHVEKRDIDLQPRHGILKGRVGLNWTEEELAVRSNYFGTKVNKVIGPLFSRQKHSTARLNVAPAERSGSRPCPAQAFLPASFTSWPDMNRLVNHREPISKNFVVGRHGWDFDQLAGRRSPAYWFR
ncbi:uncharacterized protein BCR38DRAFT_405894 [Pseudomassariella vexata]|uniref:Uncharacterized protein n=1 Tax=Pseudomassariella vexata TaxID=1141098 RepID=A0A1Y2EG41_9PEZI|nr:uncharacterized protein BCR38DRAFT_405894 [Pseudomassariella vexata]ORY70274.1 hypothetical protein BCR38DRAFT_405894 [Pseudomassariella vexata]